MIVSLALFAQLAASCGPSVHVDTLVAIARTESGFHSGAINDNTDKRSYLPRTREEAIALATDLVTVKGHSVDLGLMQINSANLPSLGMTVAQAFDPCKSVNAGARVLAAAYGPPSTLEDTQPALLQAISRYNTGHPARGFANGYVAKVQASAEQVVPAIRVKSPSRTKREERSASPTLPPSWDIFGQARYARERNGPVSDDFKPAPAPAPGSVAVAPHHTQQPVHLQPVQLRVANRQVSDER